MTTAIPFLVTGQSTSGGGTASAAISPSLTGCTVGNLFAVFLGVTGITTVPAAPTGWATTSTGAGTSTAKRALGLYFISAVAGTNSFSVTTGGPYNYVMAEFANATNVGDANTSGNTSASNPSIAQGGTYSGSLFLAAIQSTSANTTSPYVPNWTSLAGLTNTGEFNAAYTVVPGTVGSITWTQATSTTFTDALYSFQAKIAPPARIILQAVNRAAYW